MNITGGKYNSRKIKAPEYENIKPTLSKVRQGIFNSLASMIDFEDKIFVDMFAGSGIMGLEALSRGFNVFSFEKDKKTAFAVKEAYKYLGLVPNLYIGDVIKKLPAIGIKADVIFMDPPYSSGLYDTALNTIAENNLLTENGIIIAEHPSTLEIMPRNSFKIVKVKPYSDKLITFLIKSNQEE